MFCTSCGTQNFPTSEMCTKCGLKLMSGQVQNNKQPMQPINNQPVMNHNHQQPMNNNPKSNKSLLIILGIVAILVIAIVVIAINLFGDNDSNNNQNRNSNRDNKEERKNENGSSGPLKGLVYIVPDGFEPGMFNDDEWRAYNYISNTEDCTLMISTFSNWGEAVARAWLEGILWDEENPNITSRNINGNNWETFTKINSGYTDHFYVFVTNDNIYEVLFIEYDPEVSDFCSNAHLIVVNSLSLR